MRDEQGALWLAKFPARGDAFDVAMAETCTLELARRCGLTVPEVRYLQVGGRPVMLIRRFDRYWSVPGSLPEAGAALHDTRPGPGLAEGRLPYVSGLTLVAACLRPDAFGAVVPWYGLIPWPEAQPDWSRLAAPVLGHYAGADGFFTADAARELESTLRDLGKDATVHVYDGVDHAFFNDTRPEVYAPEAAALAWDRTLTFLHANLA